MFSKFKLSLRNINYKLFFALLTLGFVPTIYNTVRVFFLGQLPGEWSYSIAGQLSWVNLLYEIMNEAIILPLFYFVGAVKDDKDEFSKPYNAGRNSSDHGKKGGRDNARRGGKGNFKGSRGARQPKYGETKKKSSTISFGTYLGNSLKDN